MAWLMTEDERNLVNSDKARGVELVATDRKDKYGAAVWEVCMLVDGTGHVYRYGLMTGTFKQCHQELANMHREFDEIGD